MLAAHSALIFNVPRTSHTLSPEDHCSLPSA